MRIDIDVIPFSGVSNLGTIAILDLSGAEYASIGINITGLTGSPTTVRGEAFPSKDLAGSVVFNQGDAFGTNDVTGAPVAAPQNLMVSRIGLYGTAKSAVLAEGFLLPPPMKYLFVTIGLTGGAAPTASGTVTVWKYTR